MENNKFIKFLVGCCCGKYVVEVSDSIICTLRFGLGVKGGLFVGGAPKMHTIYHV